MKTVLRTALIASGLTVKAVAQKLGRRYSYVADCLNEHHERHLSTKDLEGFIDAINSDEPVRYLAVRRGGVFVKLPCVAAGEAEIRQRFMEVISEVGEDSSAIQRALSDGQITEREGQTVADEIDDTVTVLLQLRALVLAKAGKPTAAKMTLPADKEQRASA